MFLTQYFSERVQKFVVTEASIHSTYLIERVVNDTILSQINSEELVYFDYKTDNSVNYMIVNTIVANKIVSDTIRVMNEYFDNDYTDPTLSIPVGAIINDTLLGNFGPEIGITIRQKGTFDVNIYTDVTEIGINNSYVQVMLDINVRMLVLIPLQDHEITVQTKLPLVLNIINGEIPRYYYQGSTSTPITNPYDDQATDSTEEIVE